MKMPTRREGMGMMRVTPAEMKSCWLPALAPVCIHDLVGKMEILVTGETSVPVPVKSKQNHFSVKQQVLLKIFLCTTQLH